MNHTAICIILQILRYGESFDEERNQKVRFQEELLKEEQLVEKIRKEITRPAIAG